MEESAMLKVFGISELNELILEYSCTGEDWDDRLKLREVCKFWKANIFKGLAACKHRPWLQLPLCYHRFHDEFEGVQCDVPLQIKILEDIDSDMMSFIESNSKVITAIDIFVHTIIKTKKALVLDLVNLRSVTIELSPQFRFVQYKRLVKFLNGLVQNSNHLEQFSLKMQKAILLPADLEFPSKLTHLFIASKNIKRRLSNLIDTDMAKLVSLELASLYPDNADMEKVKKVFDKYSEKLIVSTLVLSNTFEACMRSIKVPPIPSLQEIVVRPFENIQIEGFSSNFFVDFQNLTSLTLRFENFLQLIKPGTSLEHAKYFCVIGDFMEASGEEVEALEAIGNFDLPKLEVLECKYFDPSTLCHFVPRFFAKCNNLKSLLLNADFCEPLQVTSILAQGLTTFPVDKTEWPQYTDSLKPFKDLKCLETLSIANVAPGGYKYDLEPFIFRCAFLHMPKLRKLNVTKNIGIKKTLARDWANAGRKLCLIGNYFEYISNNPYLSN